MSETLWVLRVPVAGAEIAVHVQGDDGSPAVVMTHSILSSSAMWDRQAALLVARGFRAVRIDARGHGASPAPQGRFTMDDLADDTIAVLDALKIERATFVGLSLGGMSGFGVAVRHADRLTSLVLCDCRADAPPAVAAPWDERIAIAEQAGTCAPLAAPTIERWFGKAFVESHPDIARRFLELAMSTTVAGFAGCARAIQGLNYLHRVPEISVHTTLIVGANDGVLPDTMASLGRQIAGAQFVLIPDAGHLPNIDQPAAFDQALLAHLARVTAH